MNRRRMMMSGKTEPLLVFEYGKTKLTKGTAISSGARFENGIIRVGTVHHSSGDLEWNSPDGMDISGIDFSKYKTLKIECRVNIDDYESGRELHFAGYGESTGYQKENYTAFQYAPEYYRVLSFDIRKEKGEKYIKASANHAGTAYMTIRNIRLE